MAKTIEIAGVVYENVPGMRFAAPEGGQVIFRDESDTYAIIATPYDVTATYRVNDYAMYDYALYKCISAIDTPEDWNPDHWMAVTVTDELRNVTINVDDLGLYQDPDTMYVYPVYQGIISENGIPLAGGGGGGGGGGNNAVLALTNTAGWLSKTISSGSTCPIKFVWSSLEDGLPTGDGTLVVSVDGITKRTQNVAQGEITMDIGEFISTGTNKVKVKISDVYDNAKTITYTVKVVELSISSSFDISRTYAANEAIEFTYTPSGAVTKTVHFEVDGDEVGTAVVTTSGRQQSYILEGMSHGAHTLLVYFTAEIEGETVTSNELYYSMIVVDPESRVPIISSDFRRISAAQYETFPINYTIYTPNSLTSQIGLLVDGEPIATLEVDRTEHVWNYRADEIGEITLAIATGSINKSFTLTITESDIDIHPETEALKLYLTSSGRSNNEEHPEIWEDRTNHISCTLSDFNFVSDGWVHDEDNITVLRVAGDARVQIPYKPFATDFRGTGKTIELEFATRNILNYDATLISCMSGGRGFQLTAQKALLKSEQSEISTQYKEDEHVRIAFVAEKRVEHRLLFIYINGIMSGVVQYPDDDDFSQVDPVNISIGSNSCTTDIYCIRVYDNNLTRYQILDNWIADTQDITTLLNRYEHNDVFDEYGQIVLDKLPRDLPYMVISCPELPQYKGDKKTINGYYVDPQHPSRSFSFTGASADVQGTSSQYYPRKNYKIKFNGGFTMTSTGETVAKYSMNATAIPTKTFTFKADVASSEGANNVELVRLYNSACPYKTPPQELDSRIRQGIDGFPIVIFWSDGNNTTFIGKYNFNNDKGTEEVFGFAEGDESWEIKNNTGSRVLWKSADYSGTDWLNDFEARYPDTDPAYTDSTRLSELASWLVSTDQEAATGDALPETYIDVDGNEHTVDNAAYRLAKFKTEFSQHLELQSAIFYYIFTELFLMVDSRAKNAFPSIFGDDKWCWLPYDFDTAIGINNEGALVFDYSLEDTDTTSGGADIYNGQQSVMWINLRMAFPNEIKAMYQTIRSEGSLSYNIVETAFEDHQSKWPEAIFNEDSWFKYIDPLTKDGTDYLDMAQGSKAEQRKWWLYNRFRYIDSKYNAGDALTDVITLRAYDRGNVDVTPYADIYPAVKFGSYLVTARGKRNVTTRLLMPESLTTLNDTEIYIYSASQLASIGDVSPMKVGMVDLSNATKLQYLKCGDADSGYVNNNMYSLTLGNNTLLQTLDVRNCAGLGNTTLDGHTQTSVDISGCTNIEYVYFGGTNIRALNLPIGGILKTLQLPGTITNLTIRNQKAITTFQMPDYTNITTLRVENSSSVIPVLDILASMAVNSRVRILGFTMAVTSTDDVEDFYDALDDMRGLDEAGNNLEKAVVSGTITGLDSITGEWLARMQARYPDVTIEYNHISSTLRYYNYDGTELLNSETILDGGDGTYTGEPTRTSTAQYNYTFIGWSLDTNSETADSNATKHVGADRNVYAAYSKVVRTYTVTFQNSNGTVLQTVSNVPYGGSATYTGVTPVHPTDPENFEFRAFVPDGKDITGTTVCVAQYKDLRSATLLWIEGDLTELSNSIAAQVRSSFAYNRRSITYVDLPNASIIGADAFEYATSLSTINIPKATTISNRAFNQARITRLDLPDVLSIGSEAFLMCSSLTAISVPKLQIVGDSTFKNCPSIQNLSLPEVTSIGVSAFANVSALLSVYAPNVTRIGAGAFAHCTYLTSLNFPNLESVGHMAFYNCINISTIYLPKASYIGSALVGSLNTKLNTLVVGTERSTVCSLASTTGNQRFSNSECFIYVPDSLVTDYQKALRWSSYKSRIFPISEKPE